MFIGELNQDIKTLPGVGKKTREDYANLDIGTVADLIQTMPRGYEDRSHRICIGRQNDEDGSWTNTFVRAESVTEFGPARKNVKIIVRDTENNQKAFLMGFNRTYLSKTVFPGAFYHLYANITPYGTGLTSSQFELKPVREEDISQSDENRGGLCVTKLQRQSARPSGSRPFRPILTNRHRQQVLPRRLGDKRYRHHLRPKLYSLRPLRGRLQASRETRPIIIY